MTLLLGLQLSCRTQLTAFSKVSLSLPSLGSRLGGSLDSQRSTDHLLVASQSPGMAELRNGLMIITHRHWMGSAFSLVSL